MKLAYSIGINFYVLGIRIASLFNMKAKKWLIGRRGWEENLLKSIGDKQNIYWFHCASLGEFEQGKPVMEALKKQNPSIGLLVTFFSPSGYELKKDYELADYVCYLPMDSRKNAKRFLSIINIEKAFFIKYEFWYHYFTELTEKKTPFYMISAVFRKNQIFFKWYGKWYRELLLKPTKIFVQDEKSKDVLSKYNIDSVVSGDTRFDRVYETSLNAIEFPSIVKFKDDNFLVLAGSSWQAEENILAKAFNHTYKLIIAPHDISERHIKAIEKLFPESIRYSKLRGETKQNVLIIDNIGMLSSLYQYADLAFIGGGYVGALHNILEPATFGVPVIFGPKHEKFHEAKDMLANGSAFEVNSSKDLADIVAELKENKEKHKLLEKKNKEFVKKGKGALKEILKQI